MADKTQPIIIKKKKAHHEAHHGGSWKVAYADFVTAMMAFFLLMWLMGSTTPMEQREIAKFFQDPSAIQAAGGSSTSVIQLGGSQDLQPLREETVYKTFPEVPVPDAAEIEGRADQLDREREKYQGTPAEQELQRLRDLEKAQERARLDTLKQDIEQQVQASQALSPFKDQLLIDITDEGLRIQIVDKENRPMFDLSSATLKPYTIGILHELAKAINGVPNSISITGHTDARLYHGSNPSYSNWELSADRANAARRELVKGSLAPAKITRVVGLGSTVPFAKDEPLDPINRRIAIIVLKKEVQEAIVRSAEAVPQFIDLPQIPAPVAPVPR